MVHKIAANLAGVLVFGAAMVVRAETLEMTGVNLAGAEFSYPDIAGYYEYPTIAEVTYYQSKGMNTFRLPFLWERLQPDLSAGFEPTQLAALTSFVSQATALGANVILDVHDFGQYVANDGIAYAIGSPQVPAEKFSALWSGLASSFASNSQVIFDLMNEPVGTPEEGPTIISTENWFAAAQGAVNAIRAVGAANTILVSGNYYSGAWSWKDGNGRDTPNQTVLNNLGGINDPGVAGFSTQLIYEVHQYLDQNYSGTSPDIDHSAIASLSDFTAWLRATGNQGFLGEFGVGVGLDQQLAVTSMLGYLESNSDVWTGWTWWAGGPLWPDDYFLNLEPQNGVDAPQLAYLTPFLPAAVPELSVNALLALGGLVVAWRMLRGMRMKKSVGENG